MSMELVESFLDELTKIADSAIGVNITGTKPPAPVSTTSTGKINLKPASKGTNYSVVHSAAPSAAAGTANASKSVAPPPVKA